MCTILEGAVPSLVKSGASEHGDDAGSVRDVYSTWAQSEAHFGPSAEVGPVIEGRLHAAFLQCAQEYAHAVVMIGLGFFKPVLS